MGMAMIGWLVGLRAVSRRYPRLRFVGAMGPITACAIGAPPATLPPAPARPRATQPECGRGTDKPPRLAPAYRQGIWHSRRLPPAAPPGIVAAAAGARHLVSPTPSTPLFPPARTRPCAPRTQAPQPFFKPAPRPHFKPQASSLSPPACPTGPSRWSGRSPRVSPPARALAPIARPTNRMLQALSSHRVQGPAGRASAAHKAGPRIPGPLPIGGSMLCAGHRALTS